MAKHKIYFLVNSEGLIVRASIFEEDAKKELQSIEQKISFEEREVDIDITSEHLDYYVSRYLNRSIDQIEHV